MPTDFNQRSHALLMEAVEIEDEDARRVFILERCSGDAALERRMTSLLDAVSQRSAFLETPAIRGARAPATPAVIGGYEVVRAVGLGGMATVYEAIQPTLRRRVALKVMRQGMFQGNTIERFRLEGEILAELRHPAIAQIYEIGSHQEEDGSVTPFLAMEYVADARPITVYADEENLTIPERLRLFCEVCGAVQHGHHHGVIHRDLKPSNILVDPSGVVKVIDFGIARSTDPNRRQMTAQEDLGQLLGTLNYMSPEQSMALGSPIDLRSDVYSLGVVLYELLCGRTPHDLTSAHTLDAVRILQCDEPTRPSRIIPALKGDLEIILATALMKDRSARYQTASEFSGDIKRFLGHEAIVARSASRVYQLRKFVRRHRTPVAAATAVALALVVAIVATTRQAISSDRARVAAEIREQELQRVVDFQRSQIGAIDLVDMGDRLREGLVSRLEAAGSGTSTDLSAINFTSLAKLMVEQSILDRSYTSIQSQFEDRPVLRAQMLYGLAATMHRLGDLSGAERVLEECLDIRRAELGPDHPDSLKAQALSGVVAGAVGDYVRARRLLSSALDRQTATLGGAHEDTLLTANALAGVCRFTGDLAGAQAIWETTHDALNATLGPENIQTLAVLNNVGVARAMRGDIRGSEAVFRTLLENMAKVYGLDHPQYASALLNLGLSLIDLGEADEARSLLEQALGVLRRHFGDDHPDVFGAMGSLAEILITMGDLDAAAPLLKEALAGRLAHLGPDHPATLVTRSDAALLAHAEGRRDEAIAEQSAVLELQRGLLGDTHQNTMRSVDRTALMHLDAGELAPAEALAREAMRVVEADPSWPVIPAIEHARRLASILMARGAHAEAATLLLAAHESCVRSLGRDNPRSLAIAGELASCYRAWSSVEASPDLETEAARWLEASRRR